jgi:hypothetical protein
MSVGPTSKILATGQKQKREFVSGPKMTALRMVSDVNKLAKDWAYDVVSVGFPGPVLHSHPVAANMFGQVELNAWNGRFFDAVGRKDLSGFVHDLWTFPLSSLPSYWRSRSHKPFSRNA